MWRFTIGKLKAVFDFFLEHLSFNVIFVNHDLLKQLSLTASLERGLRIMINNCRENHPNPQLRGGVFSYERRHLEQMEIGCTGKP
jgi:hypothetical protein